jgi:hypothetical protein
MRVAGMKWRLALTAADHDQVAELIGRAVGRLAPG